MVVQHNLTALNSNRMLGLTTKTMSKTTEKLASGYKVNRAADDAAGLAISEKMRKQIRGLTQASLNAQDGISAVQTAEGALGEVHDMIQRMNELAVKSANGTNSQEERDYLQSEVDRLTTEVDRVAETTKFNELNLLKGKGSGAVEPDYYKTNTKIYTPGGGSVAADTTKTADDVVTGFYTEQANYAGGLVVTAGVGQVGVLSTSNYAPGTKITYVCGGAADEWYVNGAFMGSAAPSGLSAIASGGEGKYEYTIKGATQAIKGKDFKELHVQASNNDVTLVTDKSKALFTSSSVGDVFTWNDSKQKWYDQKGTSFAAADIATAKHDGDKVYVSDSTTLVFNLHSGAESANSNKIDVQIKAMDSVSIGLRQNKFVKVDVSTETAATATIDKLNTALRNVSEQRSALGATQNRLEHTINNLDNVVENTTAAESQIRDTDMASTMVKYANTQILAQAGQAMLAQSNQANQGVLSLLQ